MLAITTDIRTHRVIGIRGLRRSLANFRAHRKNQSRRNSLADFTTTTPRLKLSVSTPVVRTLGRTAEWPATPPLRRSSPGWGQDDSNANSTHTPTLAVLSGLPSTTARLKMKVRPERFPQGDRPWRKNDRTHHGERRGPGAAPRPGTSRHGRQRGRALGDHLAGRSRIPGLAGAVTTPRPAAIRGASGPGKRIV